VRCIVCNLPDIVVFAKDHVRPGEAGGADLGEECPTAGAFEAGVVPVAVEGVEEVPLEDLAPAARTDLDAATAARTVVVVVIVVVVVDVVLVMVEGVVGREGGGVVVVWGLVPAHHVVAVAVARPVRRWRVWRRQLRVRVVMGVHSCRGQLELLKQSFNTLVSKYYKHRNNTFWAHIQINLC
jgi:hypothetical protein